MGGNHVTGLSSSATADGAGRRKDAAEAVEVMGAYCA